MPNLLDAPIFGSSPAAWLLAAVVVSVTTAGVAVMRSFLLGRLAPLKDGSSLNWRGVVYELAKRTLLFVAFVISIYAASLILKLPIAMQRG
jgi:hypothetical protein